MENLVSYTPEEVAKLLKITRFTVYEMIKRGDLVAYHIGRKVRVDAVDLENYIRNSKTSLSLSEAEKATPEKSKSTNPDGLILCGQDIILDTLSRHLENRLPNLTFLRKYIGSTDGLLALYHGTANTATAHLWDGDTDTYNLPYIRRLLPGVRTLIINLTYRNEGFYVASGNPLQINDWQDLTKPGLHLVNRERGSGARVLLDEKLRNLDIDGENILGYEQEELSHLGVASCVARGDADIGIGIEKAAQQVQQVDFIPLQKERYDLIIRKKDAKFPQFKMLLSILRSQEFKNEVAGLGGYDVSQTGEILAET